MVFQDIILRHLNIQWGKILKDVLDVYGDM